jgi:hypothetical protein
MSNLAEFVSSLLDIKSGTVIDRGKELRAEGFIGVGRQGTVGAQMTSRDATNLMLACVIEHKRGESVAANVKRVRELPGDGESMELPSGFTRGLEFYNAPTAGTAIEALLDDMRSGRIADWSNHEHYTFSVTLESRGDTVFIALTKDKRHALCGFGKRRPQMVERQVTINASLIMRLAEALGPPDKT